MKPCLILAVVLAPLVLPVQAAMPVSPKVTQVSVAQPPPAASRPVETRQLSAQERAVLRQQLYQYRNAGKNS